MYLQMDTPGGTCTPKQKYEWACWLMIFDLLTSPQGHQFDPRMKMLLAFCSARHPRQFDMLHDHV